MNTPWSLDTLMAFVDGELDASQRAELERALAADAALRERVDKLRTQRRRVEAAFVSVLDEPVPERLSGRLAAAPLPPGHVVDIAAERGVKLRLKERPVGCSRARCAIQVPGNLGAGDHQASAAIEVGSHPDLLGTAERFVHGRFLA